MSASKWWALGGAGLVVMVLGGAALVAAWPDLLRPPPGDGNPAAAAGSGLPWQVEVLPDGSSRVLGQHLGGDTLARVQARVGDHLQVALVARTGEVGALEALADPFMAGFVSGRLVLGFDVPPETLQRWRDAALGSSPMDSGARRFRLRAADLAEAGSAPLVSLSFVPLLRLSEADVRQRFGEPDSRHALPDEAALLVYAQKGVAAAVASGQRGVFQYVAPRDAARLKALAGP